ncbi:MAG: M20/M25/M40 family metallo-hydrolase [Chitinophagaceae bacterium]
MKTILRCSIIFCCFSPLFVLAQPDKADLGMVSKIRDAENKHSQVASIAHILTDVCGPRLTNSPGYKRAISWVTQTFKDWGLQNAGPEAWGEFGRGWSTEKSFVALKQPYYENIIAYPQAWTKGTNGAIVAPVILLNNFDSASIDQLGDALKGKIVIRKPRGTAIRDPFEPNATRYTDTQLNKLPDADMISREEVDAYSLATKKDYNTKLYLESKGAVALLTSSGSSRDGTFFSGGGPAYVKKYAPTLPELSLDREDYLKMIRLLQDGIGVQLQMEVQNTFYDDDLTGYNVVGEIPGTDPVLKDQVVMLGGHLDSWHGGTGATDNAAGCAVVMEAMHLLKILGIQPKRTIRVALWGGEEQGPYGSFGYVKKHFGDPLDMQLKPEQKNISAYFNLDNGSGKIRGIYLQNNEKLRPIFKAWMEPFNDLGATGITSSNTGSTDHISFDAVGIPGFQFIQDPLEYETRTHHSNMDTYDHLFIDDMRQAAVIVAAFVYQTAMRSELLPRKPLPPAGRYIYDADFPW